MFVSHSKLDQEGIDLLTRAAAGSSVQLYFAEFEKQIGVDVFAEQLAREIDIARAVIVARSSHVETIAHTGDWVYGRLAAPRTRPSGSSRAQRGSHRPS